MKKLKLILTRIKNAFDFNYYAIRYVCSANTMLEATNDWLEVSRGIQRGYIFIYTTDIYICETPHPMTIVKAKEHKKYIVNKYKVNPDDLSIIQI